MRGSDVPEGALVHRRRHAPGRQRRGDDAAGQRARLRQQDAHLDVGDVVEVQHDVGTSAVDPTRTQTVPDLTRELSPQGREVAPRRRLGDHDGRPGLDIDDRHLVVHVSIIASPATGETRLR